MTMSQKVDITLSKTLRARWTAPYFQLVDVFLSYVGGDTCHLFHITNQDVNEVSVMIIS